MDQQRHMRSKAKLAADTNLWEARRKTVALDNTAERDWLLGLPGRSCRRCRRCWTWWSAWARVQ